MLMARGAENIFCNIGHPGFIKLCAPRDNKVWPREMPRGLEHKGRRPRRNGFGVNFPQKPLATHLLLSESDLESPEPLPELLACALPPLVRLTLPLPARRFIVSELRFVEIQRINLGINGL